MRSRAILTLGLAFTLATSVAGADEGYRHGRLRLAEPGTTLQRATETEAEEAIQNLPFLPGDRVWTDASGRAMFQFPDGTVVSLNSRAKLDYAAHEEDRAERIVLRLWSGSVIVHAPSRPTIRFEIETPSGLVEAHEGALVRADVSGGDTTVRVYEGEAAFEGVRLALGEEVAARWGERPGEPERFDRMASDDFLAWDQDRQFDDRYAANSARYLPDDLDDYSGELDRNGTWRYQNEVSAYVWFPSVDAGWQPYSNGRWAWTPYGWTWVPYDRWGWAPFHYGRWGMSASLGWYWIPDRTWGPAWVSWAVGGGYAAWCPLGWRDRPVSAWGHWNDAHIYGGRAVARGRYDDPWHVVRQGELGRRDVGRYRLPVQRVDPSVLRVSDSPLDRPTRDVAVLRHADPAPAAIRTRMTPGDFVRELSVDNKTTIPAPWTRGYGPPPAGVEGARYGTPRRTGSSGDDGSAQNSRAPMGAAPRGGATSSSEAGAADPGAVTASPRSAPRPTPWYTPSSGSGSGNDATSGGGSGASSAPRGGSGSGAASGAGDDATRSRPVFGSGYRQRSEDEGGSRGGSGSGSGDGAGYRSRGESGGSRPQGDGGSRGGGMGGASPRSGGETRSSGGGLGGGSPRPSSGEGGSHGSSGGGHPRPHHE
ncbi:MAG: FecR family protein [Vicinamibacteria bacterium]